MTSNDSPAPQPTPEQATDITHPGGMRGNRVMPTPRLTHLDPFVVFERFYIDPTQGFTTHPHRGFEIVSYMLAGGMRHDDSLGESHTARDGDVMRITTGSGIQHSELPADGAACNGLQLWVNLPREKKGIDPSYQDATAAELPVEQVDGATVTTVVGEGSPITLETDVECRDVNISDEWEWRVPDGWHGVCYAISGTGSADGHAFAEGDYVVQNGGTTTFSSDDDLRVAAISGQPHGEPIHQRGPFVD
ncbi:pirin family protein [Haladaptatus sp. DJG-WS-42]|uniref:pirin family protein n=1 Tax=Haladaptatus sp. DJG-WS-42 TaxID=3120516 RepID=UPI0030CC7107